MADLDVEQIRAAHEAATPGPYRWAGNTDYGDVRLAAANGSEVFALVDRERTVDDPQSRAYASYLELISEKIDGEFRPLTADEIAERVRAAIAYDEDEEQPPTYAALAFYVPGFAYEHARDNVTYEVTRYQDLPEGTPRSHEGIYRADVVDVRNPNARFLRDSWEYVEFLLGEVAALRGERDAATALAARLAHVAHAVDVWAGEHVNDHRFTRDNRAEVRAVVAAARDGQNITDPYQRVIQLDHENAALRGLIAGTRQQIAKAADELDDADGSLAWPGALLVAAMGELDHALAEPDPYAPDIPAPALLHAVKDGPDA